jgi:hypothetical protein
MFGWEKGRVGRQVRYGPPLSAEEREKPVRLH